MEKQILHEEDAKFNEIKAEWFCHAKTIKTPDELAEFSKHLLEDYVHDYGTVVRATSAIALASAWMCATKEGLTGFQAGFVMWDFIKEWCYKSNECGLRIIDYDNMLYPQYEDYFTEKTITKRQWEDIQEQARKRLVDCGADSYTDDRVIKHWKSIINGKIPFGYHVKEDE